MLFFTLLVYLIMFFNWKFATCEDKCAAFNIDEVNVQLTNIQTVKLKFRIVNRCATVGVRNLSVTVVSADRNSSAFCLIDISFDGGIGNCTEIGSCSCPHDGTFSVDKQLVNPGGEVWALEGRLYNGETFGTRFETPGKGFRVAMSSSWLGAPSSQFLGAVTEWTTETIPRAVTQTGTAHQGLTTKVLTLATTQYEEGTLEWEDVPGKGLPKGNFFTQFGILQIAAIGGGLFALIILLVCLLHCRLMSRINSVQGRQLIASMETDAEVTKRRSRLKQFRSSAAIAARLLVRPENPDVRESRVYQEICTDKAAFGSRHQDLHLDNAHTYIEMTSPGRAPAKEDNSKESDMDVLADMKPAHIPSARPINEDTYLTRPVLNARQSVV